MGGDARGRTGVVDRNASVLLDHLLSVVVPFGQRSIALSELIELARADDASAIAPQRCLAHLGVKVMRARASGAEYLAVARAPALDALFSTRMSASADLCRRAEWWAWLAQIPGVVYSHRVRFWRERHHAVLIPFDVVSAAWAPQ